jgi:hypothetical protein
MYKKIIVETTEQGQCTSKGYTEKTNNKIKPSWWEKEPKVYDYCSDGAGTNLRYYRKKKTTSVEKKDETKTTTPKTTTPKTTTTTYSVCSSGTLSKGCKDSGSTKGSPNVNGDIYKLQGCLKVVQDGYFGSKTEAALLDKTQKKGILVTDIPALCSGTATSTDSSVDFTLEKQKVYWENLKEKGQVYKSGVMKKLVNSQMYVYIVKRKKDGTKVPMVESDVTTTTDEAKLKLIESFDEFDYEVLYPINPGSKVTKGSVGVLTAGLNQNDELFVKILKDSQGFWSPADVEEKFEEETPKTIQEQAIRKILWLRLLEQKVTRTIGSSSDPNKTYTSTTTTSKTKTSTTDGTTTVDVTKNKEELVKTTFKDKRQKVLSILKTEVDEGDIYSSTLQPAYEFLLKFPVEKYCETESLKQLNIAIKQIEDNRKFVIGETKDAIDEVYNILITIGPECKKINTKIQDNAKSAGTTAVTAKSITTTDKAKDITLKTSEEEKTVYVDGEVKSFLEDKGFTFEKPGLDEKDKLATRTTVGEQLRNFDADGIYTEYYEDTTQIWKERESPEDISDIESTLSQIKSEIPEEQKKKVCRKAIKRLYISAFPAAGSREKETRSIIEDDTVLNNLKTAIIQCDEQMNFPPTRMGMGNELTSLYRCRTDDNTRSYYGINRYCLKDFKPLKQDNPMMQRESIVKKHIFEAIKNKKKETMVESILRKIKSGR